MASTSVRVDYHHEPEGWWADSPDVEGFAATGETLSEVRQLVHEGLPFYLETSDLEIVEAGPADGLVIDVRLTGVATQVRWDLNEAQWGPLMTRPAGRAPAWA